MLQILSKPNFCLKYPASRRSSVTFIRTKNGLVNCLASEEEDDDDEDCDQTMPSDDESPSKEKNVQKRRNSGESDRKGESDNEDDDEVTGKKVVKRLKEVFWNRPY